MVHFERNAQHVPGTATAAAGDAAGSAFIFGTTHVLIKMTALAAASMDVVLVEEVLVVSVETVLKVLVQTKVEEHLGQVDLEKNLIFQERRNFMLEVAVEDIGEELVVETLLHKVVQEEVVLVESVVD